ncbi:MAG TPA: C39 family peptidase [Patescibacteria group bacterium]|jgi:peptidoglycan hydrolase CwlO-like protein|nr:C39 family peptidase [Patescibacteria group bacterium]
MRTIIEKLTSKLTPALIFLAIAIQTIGGFFMPQIVIADSNNDAISALTQQIAQYQAELKKLGSDKKTLQAAIKSLDLQRGQVEAQVKLTQHEIGNTQDEIQSLDQQIESTNKIIESNKIQLAAYMRELQQHEDQPIILQLVSANSLSDFWQDLEMVTKLTNTLHQKSVELQEQQKSLTSAQNRVKDQQDSLTNKNEALTGQKLSLSATESSKADLLKQTKSQEGEYQKLLANAKKQLDSFSAFTKNAGGSGSVGTQTSCDAWGCYYNQRDSAWGGQALNGTQYTLASDGCLVTSMAMVMTHYGYKVTPANINANPSNFASYFSAYLLFTISAGGATASRKSTDIDSTLAGGDPVIVGMNVYGGTHFVVLVSGSNGNYIMRDPYVSGGKDIPFTSHYSTKMIYSAAKVVIN